jgi:hypothetical protein
MGILIIEALAILLGPGFLCIIAGCGIGDDKSKWKMPLFRIGIFLLVIGILLFALLAVSCNDLRQHPIN